MLLSKYPALITLVKELYYNYHAKIKFTINPRISGLAFYDTSDKTICLHKEDYLTNEQVIMEELLHAVQHHLLGTFYMSAKKNAKFEVKVIRDVLGKDSSYYGLTGKENIDICKDYPYWIYYMRNGGRTNAEEFNKFAYAWQDELNSRYDKNFNPMLLNYCIQEMIKYRK